jgi:hypothetical protein
MTQAHMSLTNVILMNNVTTSHHCWAEMYCINLGQSIFECHDVIPNDIRTYNQI